MLIVDLHIQCAARGQCCVDFCKMVNEFNFMYRETVRKRESEREYKHFQRCIDTYTASISI